MTGSARTGAAPDAPRRLAVKSGDMVVSCQAGDVLITGAPVGSCVVVCLSDPASSVAGLLHFLWPESKLDPARAEETPAAFADTGLTLLLDRVAALGVQACRCTVRLVGGADVGDREEASRWAKRNVLAARSALWRSGILLDGEDVGGSQPRRAALIVSNGRLSVTVDDGV